MMQNRVKIEILENQTKIYNLNVWWSGITPLGESNRVYFWCGDSKAVFIWEKQQVRYILQEHYRCNRQAKDFKVIMQGDTATISHETWGKFTVKLHPSPFMTY